MSLTRPERRGRNASALAVVVAAALGLACTETPERLGCGGTGVACPTGKVCSSGLCLPRLSSTDTWQVELTTPTAPRVALAALPDTLLLPEGNAFALPPPTEVRLRLDPTAGGLRSDAAVQFRASVLAGPAVPAGSVFQAEVPILGTVNDETVLVPPGFLGQTGTVALAPLPPTDLLYPPWRTGVTLQKTLALVLPPFVRASGVVRLSPPGMRGAVGYEVVALANGTRVSNRARVQADGTFKLVITGDYEQRPLTLTATPSSSSGLDRPGPSLTAEGIAVVEGTTLPTLVVPPFIAPAAYAVPVLGPDGTPVAGAVVRFTAALDGTRDGVTARFRQAARTDVQGVAAVALIGGSVDEPVRYDVEVIAPPGDAAASRCVPNFSVLNQPDPGAPRTIAALVLERRARLNGRVLGGDRRPVGGVHIVLRASVGPPDPDSGCTASLAASPVATNTDAAGRYTVWLDPGSYAVTYQPPGGSPWAALGDDQVALTGDLERTVVLPVGEVVDGVVTTLGSDAGAPEPVPACVVRLLGGPSGQRPGSPAEGVTAPDGRFRLVVGSSQALESAGAD